MIDVISRVAATVSADTAWRLLGGFDSLPVWIPMIRTSTLEDGGRIRRLTTVEGATIVERVLRFDEQERLYTYAYVSGPDPVEDYVGKVAVEESGPGRCVITWGSRFKPAGLSDAEARQRYQAAYTAALLHAKCLLESGNVTP
ncbi:SRPBCC family protein [Nguyenibacter vanlangensis]|uniref:SRPBCC family protein n=1 Tax=Nguyenibacter vanlangensis TaxID=1216886 RepID=A0A7Y7ITL4_9PROT|nr:SRPBCC family protein [Nguyenibacter vanlangensis]NVN10098.1 SRPBCC family protein [Nguyenibacter vanlangensis]